MSRPGAIAARRRGAVERLFPAADHVLRVASDQRLAIALLLGVAGLNALAAAVEGLRWLLTSPAYLGLLGAVLLSGVAGVGARSRAAWREWREPAALPSASGRSALIPIPVERAPVAPALAVAELRAAGYRVAERGSGSRWVAAGVRRGWSRLAGLLSHLAVLVVVVGVAVGSAFGSEMQLSLLPGEQALLGAPRAGFTDAVRLDRFTGEFAADGTPTRLDTEVTFLRDGAPVRESLLQVNRPGSFGGYALHPWTYGPAAHLRVTALGGQPLLDAAVALDGTLDGRAAAFVDLPSQGLTLGVQLADPAGNALSIVLADGSGTVDAVRLAPGEAARIGGLRVSHGGLDAYVTFLSRRDPGLGLVYAGGGLLVASLAVALWLPRRRATVRFRGDRVELTVRGERFDSSNAGLDMLRARLAAALGPAG